MAKKTQQGSERGRIELAAAEGRHQQALERARQLFKYEATLENRQLLHKIGMGRARQLHREGKTRDALALLESLRETAENRLDWLQEIGVEMAACGGIQQALGIIAGGSDPAVAEAMLASAVDVAVQKEKAGRELLPESLREDFDRLLTAFGQVEAGQDEAARETLQAIGLRSPFLEWKVFLRGLQAYYQNDDVRAMENWQRLKPDRLPAKLAAPFRFEIDKDYRSAQPPAVQKRLAARTELLQGGDAARLLRALREELARARSLAPLFRQAEQALAALKREAPHLVPRLATVIYWATMTQGQPEDVALLRRVFGSLPEDPHYHRLEALAWERAGALEEAHKHWLEYQKEIAARPQLWPGEQGPRARALLWERMGLNAETIPEGVKIKRLPPELRNHPQRPKPLKPGAEECFKQSLALAPDNAETHVLLFQHYKDQEKPDKAVKAARDFLEKQPDHVEMLTLLGDLFMNQRAYHEALEEYQRAHRNNPLDRLLQQKLGSATLFSARTRAEAGNYDQARQEYQSALERDPSHRAMILSKWAMCEYKAGDNARGEALHREAVTLAGELSAAYDALIEIARLKLKPAVKKPIDEAFKKGIGGATEPRSASGLADTVALHHIAGIDYHGQKTHTKKVLDYLKRAIKLPFTEEQMEAVCRSLAFVGGYRLTREYCEEGRRRFPQSPLFPLLQAENEISRGPGMFRSWDVESYLKTARAMADKLPLGPKREMLLERIAKHESMLEMLNPFGRMFDDIFGGMDPFGYDEEENF